MLRLVVREVTLDQKRERGLVWLRITWQTGAASEHRVRRRVRGYSQYAETARLERRIRELNAAGLMDREVAASRIHASSLWDDRSRRMRASAIALVVTGCGRIGFDPLATSHGVSGRLLALGHVVGRALHDLGDRLNGYGNHAPTNQSVPVSDMHPDRARNRVENT